MIEKIGIFILFLSPLVFVHELGHFLLCKVFRVRVEVFSIGFGPKIIKFKKGFTEYAISLIPLGGYVKMFGDDILQKDNIPERDRDNSFLFKGKWARFCIVVAGPIANFFMTYVLFIFLLLSGETLPEIRLGTLDNSSSMHQIGLRSGDVFISMNGKKITNPTDIDTSEGKFIRTIKVKRGDKEIQLIPNMNFNKFITELMKNIGPLRNPVLVNSNGEEFLLSDSLENASLEVSLDLLLENRTQDEMLLFKLPTNYKAEKLDFNKLEFSKIDLRSTGSTWNSLHKAGLYSVDMLVKNVRSDSPAEKAGIKKGDILFSLDNFKLIGFESLRNNLQEITKTKVELNVVRNGEMKSFMMEPEETKVGGKKVKVVGVESSISFVKPGVITTEGQGLFTSAYLAIGKTADVIGKTFYFLRDLITGDISIKNVGGPIAIGSVASQAFNFSITYFLRIMAILSANLGLINLFPIPVLDGGHIMFIGYELIKGSPLSRRKLELAQQFGLSLLLLLMVVVFYNDFSRLDIFSNFFN